MNYPVPPSIRGSQTTTELAENLRLARMSVEAPRMPWDDFVREFFVWRQGEHVALIGPTGQGKTTLLRHLLPMHPYVVVFATKPRDESMQSLIRGADWHGIPRQGVFKGYYPLRRWQSMDPKRFPKRVLWPDATTMDSVSHQRVIFHDAFARIYREGGWTVAIDELWYVNNILKLEMDVRLYLLQARALGISLLAATQRPAWVPLEVYDQSTHLFFWRDNDETNLRRLSGISFRSADLIRMVVSNLEKHQVLYVNTRTGEMVRTRSPKIDH